MVYRLLICLNFHLVTKIHREIYKNDFLQRKKVSVQFTSFVWFCSIVSNWKVKLSECKFRFFFPSHIFLPHSSQDVFEICASEKNNFVWKIIHLDHKTWICIEMSDNKMCLWIVAKMLVLVNGLSAWG